MPESLIPFRPFAGFTSRATPIALCGLMLLLASSLPRAQSGGPVSLSTLDVAHVEPFDTLAPAGSSSELPAGWAISEAGANANGSYTAGTGSSNAGDTYSFGAASSSDRALGGLQSSNLNPTFGAAFTNNTGAVISALDVSYTGEQWRLGATGRQDRLDFQYSLDATGLGNGTWVDVNELDFNGPITSGATGALDGNAAANRTAIAHTIAGLAIPAGATFWVRWTDFNASGADDGLAVDDFSITPRATGPATSPAGVGAASPSTVLRGDATLLTVTVTPGANPASTGLTVTADLTPIGGAAAQPLFDDASHGDVTAGDLVFSFAATVPAATAAGLKELAVGITDAEARTGPATITLTVTAPGPPTVVLTAAATAYTQDFNTLATAGTANDALPVGWFLVETGGGARDNERYAADTGASNTGDTYSYGAAGAPERALGTLRSATLVPVIGAAFTNDTGALITALEISYTGEQWRLGTAGREDRLAFQYSLDASSLSDGTWTAVAALDFVTSSTTGTAGPRDGNAAEYRTPLAHTVAGLAVAPGAAFWIRWVDLDAPGADDGLAVDDFSITPNPRPRVAISQVYGGGGNSGATLRRDFIEIFNRGAVAADLTGWSVQYASAAGAGSWQKTDLPPVVLQPGQYFLVAEAAGTGGTQDLPAPDVIGTIAMSGTAGKVALLSTQVTASGACPAVDLTIDLVGYGAANCAETGPTPALTNSTAALRNGAGCVDTGHNALDFTVGAPLPRNTSSPLNTCGGGTAPTLVTAATPNPAFAGESVLIAAVITPGTGPDSTGLTVTADLSAIGGGAAQPLFDDGTSGDVVVAGDLTFAVLTSVPVATAPGSKVIEVTVGDAQGRSRTAEVVLAVVAEPTCAATHQISAIQGNGAMSPLAGQTVTSEGIVYAVRANGFFMQMAAGDGDPATSDGVFVFTSTAPPAAVAVGNLVCVTGGVAEFVPPSDPFQAPLTEIVSPVVVRLSSGNPLPAATAITAAATSGTAAEIAARLEALEGMRVSVASLTVVGPTARSGGINEAAATLVSSGVFYGVVTGVPRPFREAGIDIADPVPACAAGGACAIPRFDGNPERLRIVSTGLGGARIDVPAGAIVTDLVGPLDYAFRAYSILPETTPAVTDTVVVQPVPAAHPQEITVASLNMLRFFDDQNDPDFTGSEPVLTAAAWERRLTKASRTIREVLRTPDIIGVVEMENQAALDALAARLNADAVAAGAGDPGYVGSLVTGNDVGGIDVGVLWKAGRFVSVAVEQVGKDATFANPNTGALELLNDRPPLVVRALATRPSGQPLDLIVVVNHLRSLNGIDSPEPQAGCLSGAPCTLGARVRAKRQAQAEYLAQLVADLQAAQPAAKILLVGDFNAFEVNDGYVDVIGTVTGAPAPPEQVVVASPDLVDPDLTNLQAWLPPDQRYSYTFDGNAQTLDHALASAGLMPWVSRFAYGRSNADFPEILFNTAGPARLSDHDGSVTYIATGAPRITGRIVGKAGRAATVDLEIANTGGGIAFDVTIGQLIFRTLSGAGTVTTSTPAPIAIGRLNPGEARTIRLSLTVPASVTRFSITENGTLFDSTGALLRYSAAQSVIP